MRLGPERVRIVSACLDVPAARLAQLRAWLCEHEQARAERFVFEVHRRRFAAARGILRELLARELGVPPQGLRFEHGPHGKPRLGGGFELRFNVSHSQELALFALARERELGVDIEAVRGDVDHPAIASRFFSPLERAALQGVPEGERASAFFAIWTRKEACVKLMGGGLSIPLDGFDVSLDEPAHLLRAPQGAAAGIELVSLDAPPGFRAALAFAGGPAEIERRML
jgi:4'-phosphopantetheinyl transferase